MLTAVAHTVGCHIIPGLLNDLQQQHLFSQALTSFPEPPNRSNLTPQHGRFSSLWAAAQQGLFLQPYIGDPHANHQQTQASKSADSCQSLADAQSACVLPCVRCKVRPSLHTAVAHQSLSPCSLTDKPHNSGQSVTTTGLQCSCTDEQATASCYLASEVPSTQPASQSLTDQQERQCAEKQGQQGCWSTAPVGPSAASLLHKLRWVALGPQFNWSTRQYENEPGVKPLPPQLVSLAQHVVQACQDLQPSDIDSTNTCHKASVVSEDFGMHGLSCQATDSRNGCKLSAIEHLHTEGLHYQPNTALVNFYRAGDTLGGHKDDAELHHDCPIVSLSLGCDAVFLIGGVSKDIAPSAVWVHSGDALVLSGPARQCYHGVPRVMPRHTSSRTDSGEASCQSEMAAYMQSARVNISIRQT